MATIQYAGELVDELKEAIYMDDFVSAQDIVGQLAKLRLKLDINIVEEQNDPKEKPFEVTVQVEDRDSSAACFQLLVTPTDKIEDLKRRVSVKYKFPVEVQRWIIGQRIPVDQMMLCKCGVTQPTTVFLYILPAHTVGLKSHHDGNREYEDDNILPGVNMNMYNGMDGLQATGGQNSDSVDHQDQDYIEEDPCGAIEDKWICPQCTLSNPATAAMCELCKYQPQDSSYTTVDGRAESIKSVSGLAFGLGERVVWLSENGNERGTVRWIGTLPDVEGERITVGVEFDNPVGTGTGKYKDKQLFVTRIGHAALVPVIGLIKEKDLQL